MWFWYFMKIGNVLIIPQENIYQPNQVLFIIENSPNIDSKWGFWSLLTPILFKSCRVKVSNFIKRLLGQTKLI